jgi:hypothetical protein
MEKKKDYCFRHSKMFEGWQCPMCADEEARPAGAGAQAAATRHGRPGAEASAPGPASGRRSGPPSRGDSTSKCDQAEAMLVNGAAQEALDYCESAAELDPSYLRAHLLGARASRALGDRGRESEFLEDAAALLRSDEYRRDGPSYREILKYARDPALVTKVARTFAGGVGWPVADAIAMAGTLVGRGAVSDALIVLDSVPKKDRTLVTWAYSVQLAGGAVSGADPDLRAYLGATPAERRGRILTEMVEVQSSSVISGAAVSRVRDEVRIRYQQWVPEIKRLIGEEARAAATARLAPQLTGAAVAWAGRFLAGSVVVAVILAATLGGTTPVLGLGALVALGGAGVGFVYGRDVELKKRLVAELPKARQELASREGDMWGSILDDDRLPASPETGPAEEAETCPFCAAAVSADDATCPQCSRSLQVQEPGAAAVDAVAAPAEPDAEPDAEPAAPEQ